MPRCGAIFGLGVRDLLGQWRSNCFRCTPRKHGSHRMTCDGCNVPHRYGPAELAAAGLSYARMRLGKRLSR